MRSAVVLALVAAIGTARADTPPDPAGPPPSRARELYEKGDYAGARIELQREYELSARPELLFALGQCEYHLGNYQAAIDYYERFLATGPDEHDTALTQQALGAARTERDRPTPPPPPPTVVFRRRWSGVDWALTAGGVLAIGTGAALIEVGRRRGNDTSGTIGEYDDRLRGARRLQWIGVGVSVAGVAAIAAAFIHYGVHRERVEIGITATGDEIGVTLTGSL
jgi:tetratricopeptide (TPR) repeat protein